MDTLDRATAAKLARVICEDVIRWEPGAYAEAKERGRVREDLAESIDAARTIFLSRAPSREELFERAVTQCLVEGDFDGFEQATRAQAESAASSDTSAADPNSPQALGQAVNDVTTLVTLVQGVHADSLEIFAAMPESRDLRARITASKTGPTTWLVIMHGPLGSPGPLVELSPEKGFFAVIKRIGELTVQHPVVDDAYIIRGSAECLSMLRRLLDPLERLVDPAGEIRFDEQALHVVITVDGTRECAHTIDAILDLWAREVNARLF